MNKNLATIPENSSRRNNQKHFHWNKSFHPNTHPTYFRTQKLLNLLTPYIIWIQLITLEQFLFAALPHISLKNSATEGTNEQTTPVKCISHFISNFSTTNNCAREMMRKRCGMVPTTTRFMFCSHQRKWRENGMEMWMA